jgi:hypothetical protein
MIQDPIAAPLDLAFESLSSRSFSATKVEVLSPASPVFIGLWRLSSMYEHKER